METKIRAINRVTNVVGDLLANEAGEQLIARGSADYEDITRSGYGFHCINPTTTAAVTAVPTTAAIFSIWNSADDGGRSIIIDAVFGYAVAGGAVLYQAGMIYVLGQTRVATNGGAIVVRRNNGYGATSDSIAVCDDVTTLDAVTGVAVGWTPIGNSITSAVASLGGLAIFERVDGRIIVPPGRNLGLHVLASAVGTTWQVGVMWHERQLTLA
jgi:hypothetical protein